jgi:MFS family permease
VAAALPDPEELRAGNGLLNVVFSVAFAVGPAVAGGAVSLAGARSVLAAGAVLLLAMMALARLAPLPALAVSEEERGDGWWTKLKTGLAHLRDEPVVSRALCAQSVLLVGFTMVPPIEVVYARHDLGTTATGFGALMACWGIGAVAGSAFFAHHGRLGTIPLAAGASAAVGVAYLGMGLAGSLGVACALSVVGGLGNGMQWIAFVTAVQERVPAALQARAMSLVEGMGAAVPGLGFALGGAIAAAFTARTAYVAAGVGILGIVALGALALRLAAGGVGGAQPAASR